MSSKWRIASLGVILDVRTRRVVRFPLKMVPIWLFLSAGVMGYCSSSRMLALLILSRCLSSGVIPFVSISGSEVAFPLSHVRAKSLRKQKTADNDLLRGVSAAYRFNPFGPDPLHSVPISSDAIRSVADACWQPLTRRNRPKRKRARIRAGRGSGCR